MSFPYTPAQFERFESHHWQTKKTGSLNRYREPIYKSECTECGATPSSLRALSYCSTVAGIDTDPKGDSRNSDSIFSSDDRGLPGKT